MWSVFATAVLDCMAATPGLLSRADILGLPSTPVISPSYPLGPYFFKNREYFIIVYETDEESLRKVVPEPLKPAPGNLVMYEWIAMPDSSGFGSYQESGTVIPCLFEGQEVNYTAQMFLDCEPPIAAGREVWGFPKKYAMPKLQIESDTLTGTLEYAGQQVAVGTMVYKHRPLDHAACAKSMSKTSCNLKIIPGPDFKPAICQLVAYNLEAVEILDAWHGAARLHLKPHANAATAALPIKRVIEGKHIKAHLTLPHGRVLFDYLQHTPVPATPLPVRMKGTHEDDLTADRVVSASSMPAICPSYPRSAALLKNREYLIIRYRTQREAVLPLVPAEVQLPAEAEVIITWIHTESSGLGTYSKCTVHVPVLYQGEEHHLSVLSVLDSSAPITFGREVWGQPQKFGKPELRVTSDTLEARVRHGSQLVVEASMTYKHRQVPADEARRLLAYKELNLKIIPDVRGHPAIAQLVLLQHQDISVCGAWAGPARLYLVPHVNAPFADLPVQAVLSAHHVLADITLPAGTVVHDYLVKP